MSCLSSSCYLALLRKSQRNGGLPGVDSHHGWHAPFYQRQIISKKQVTVRSSIVALDKSVSLWFPFADCISSHRIFNEVDEKLKCVFI